MLPRAYERMPKDLLDDIIVMDDGSKDNTSEVARELNLKVFRHEPNRGYGGNLKAGLKQALELGADYVMEVHGDGAQFDPQSLRYALEPMSKGAQLILGSRFQQPAQALKNGMPLIRFAANIFLSFFDRLVLRLPLTEFHTGFRIYGRQLLQTVPFETNSNDYLFSFEIIAQAAYYNLPVAEVPVEADYNAEHTSHALVGAAIYAMQTFLILGQFILARAGLSYYRLFPKLLSTR
jgi:glycosyltransferase involved in cell wall biosynthesis